ncbi:aspartate carbamoyltransferase regulatory subunit [Tissierella creatinini]|nr:aspartate carbamoyltransferase regulatory subunit [Tissierella creatinini]TJX67303.1 aspartate carbamoyltransferase regulatory subunit [Soehngenia saccharolytica]
MLKITTINKGIVIDHIQAGKGLKLFHFLKLDEADFTVALIMNASSKKLGRKDIIKIEDVIDLDLTMIGFLDPNMTVNIIEDDKIIEKIKLTLPEKLEGILSCKNPRCITRDERDAVHKFVLLDKEKGIYKCEYCDHIYS